MTRTLGATYRLQLHRDFGFQQAQAIAPYLASLGVTHAYTSPILAACAGSTHGYDVVDPVTANPELGGEEGRVALAAALRENGLGHLLDIVPNHMGIRCGNRYWEDVLAFGRQSRYARWFDVDWKQPVVLPVLGDELEGVLARNELAAVTENGEPRLRYFDHTFPLSPESIRDVPASEITRWGEGGEQGARLRHLLEQQHYRLGFWRRATREINYRRFFDVNDLVALRAEDPEVFDATHARILEWVADGSVDGLRVDHIDGLRDPLAYLVRLRSRVGDTTAIVVEKILSPGEQLRNDWPVQGTTGYEFLNDLQAIFIDPEGFDIIRQGYLRLAQVPGHERGFRAIGHRGKLKILRGSLRADLRRLLRLLWPIARDAHPEKRPARPELAAALEALIAAFPTYRSYVDDRDGGVHPDDRAMIQTAAARVTEAAQAEPALVRFLVSVLTREGWEQLSRRERERRLAFIQRFQQITGPATAKGVEDTALYQYVPLVSLNEVGGEPERPLAQSISRLHAGNQLRATTWPHSLICTNTHDTKRSADVRARLDVLSEMPADWLKAVRRWRRMNRPLRGRAGRRSVPDPNTEYLLYQTAVGMWPAGRPADQPGEAGDSREVRERIVAYMVKAVREGKQRSAWTENDDRYEDALQAFIEGLFDATRSAGWLADLSRIVARVARPGFWNALSRVAIHLTSPGVPDIYRGDEIWNFTLVDPDNRGPVDYDVRRRMLEQLDTTPPDVRELMDGAGDGRIKLFVMSRLLRARRTRMSLFIDGGYEPIGARGGRERHIVAFARTGESGPAITVATRFPRTLAGDSPPVGAAIWGDTSLPVPYAGVQRWTCAVSGHSIEQRGAEPLAVGEILSHLPVALLLPGSS